MKAQDSVKNYPSALREMTNFSVRGIKKICKDVGPRPAGSEQEHEAQKLMAAELDGACDKVEIEPFDVHPGAFLGWMSSSCSTRSCSTPSSPKRRRITSSPSESPRARSGAA